MGNITEGLTEESEKDKLDRYTIRLPETRNQVPNEQQYNQDAAYGMIAYKNQNPDGISDLDLARSNFENKYKAFLNTYGQYSNVALNDTNGVPLTYPVGDYFSKFTRLKPTSMQSTPMP